MPNQESRATNLRAIDLRARQRQRVRRKEKRQELAKLRDESKFGKHLDSRCWLNEAIDMAVCQIFTFLNVREHWKLSRTSTKMKAVSLMIQASPIEVDLYNGMRNTLVSPGTSKKVIKRLLNFRLVRLTAPINVDSDWIDLSNLSQLLHLVSLRELTLSNPLHVGHYLDSNTDFALRWVAKLTRLEKLKVPERYLAHLLPPLPNSLTHLDLSSNNKSNFDFLDVSQLSLKQQHLTALQVLKLPNQFYELSVLGIGKIFPALRELSFGFLHLANRTHVHFTELSSCKHLEALTIGLDSEETICHWESLAPMTALRRLTVSIYRDYNPSNIFDGLSQVTQLTHLKFVSYNEHLSNDISLGLSELAHPAKSDDESINTEVKTAATSSMEVKVENSILPQLTTLLIAGELIVCDFSSLSAFATITELQLPESFDSSQSLDTLHFPHLRTLHVFKGQSWVPNYFKDQIETVIYKGAESDTESADEEVQQTVTTLSQMKKLTTVKLHPHLASLTNNRQSVAHYFRKHLPKTVEIQIDSSMNEN